MKQSEPNPLQQELARSPVAGPHPDFDTLAALAEGKLLPRERTEVFAHLATCADCRGVLAVAAEAAPLPATGTKPFLVPRATHKPLRAWLPWASIAAGIIVACSAGLLYKQKLELKPRATIARESTPAIPAANTRPDESSKSAEPTVASGKIASPSTSQESKTSIPAKESSPQSPPAQESNTLAIQADSRPQKVRIESSLAAEVSPEGNRARLSAPTPAGSAFAGAELPLPAVQASVAAIARPHWRINTSGQAERSFGNEAWEAVLADEKARMRVISVFDGDVWVGGENTRLYHSVDNGSTWNLVSLPQKDRREHAIIHIRFQTSQAGTVEAADGVVWTTADGGVSWN
jgi:hypothetical protein